MSNSESQIAQGSLVTKDQTNINLIWKACIMIKKLNKIAIKQDSWNRVVP